MSSANLGKCFWAHLFCGLPGFLEWVALLMGNLSLLTAFSLSPGSISVGGELYIGPVQCSPTRWLYCILTVHLPDHLRKSMKWHVLWEAKIAIYLFHQVSQLGLLTARQAQHIPNQNQGSLGELSLKCAFDVKLLNYLSNALILFNLFPSGLCIFHSDSNQR